MKKRAEDFFSFEIVCTSRLPCNQEMIFCVLEESGAQSVWSEYLFKDEINTHALLAAYPEKEWLKRLADRLNTECSAYGDLVLSVRPYARSDWLEEWKKFYRPEKIGEDFWILPAWEDGEGYKGTTIRIDPGMAFGTGGHPTTKMCLRFMKERLPDKKAGFSFLDMGTGSGVLAIAAWKLNAGLVVGVDNDAVALENARKNISLNGASVRLESSVPQYMKFDCIVSNILAETHAELSGQYSNLLNSTGEIILSGILKTRRDLVQGAMELKGFKLVKEHGETEWTSLLFNKVQGAV